MSKYIKIEVPDEFEGDTVFVDGNEVPVWQPQYINCLDHGYVGMVDFMGDDMAVVNAARVSYGRGTQKKRSDEGLIRYLMRHRHTTPFEMCEFKFHVKAPIFVFRQWHRHRTASINEMSARYSVLDNEMYIPAQEQTLPQSNSNRQGREGNHYNNKDYQAVVAALDSAYEEAYDTYKYLLGEAAKPASKIHNRALWVESAAMEAIRKAREETGEYWSDEMIDEKIKEWFNANELQILNDESPDLSRELARMVLPVSTYSQMYWKTNLKNLLHFISLRSDPHAQYEIRVYSDAMYDLIKDIVPWSALAFMDYQMDAETLSSVELEALQHLCSTMGDREINEAIDFMKAGGASDREIREFKTKLGF